MSQKLRIGPAEFAVNLACCWELMGKSQIPTNLNFHQSLAAAFSKAQPRLEGEIDLSFRIVPDPIHGDSETVQDMFVALITRGIGQYWHPDYRWLHLAITPGMANDLLSPLSANLRSVYEQIAREALENYKPA